MSGANLLNPSRLTPYAANGVNFDGANDYLTRGADLTGAADSKLWSGSVWFKRAATGSMALYAGTSDRPFIQFRGSGGDHTIQITARSAGGSAILNIESSAITDTTSWHHIMWAVDMADEATKSHLYVDGVSDLTVNTYTDDTIDFSRTGHTIGAKANAGSKYDGCLADFWLAFAQYIDLSVAANREKFRSAAGSPVNLGGDGSNPTGTAAIMFFSGATAAWETNKGTGGGFTENGALSDCASDP